MKRLARWIPYAALAAFYLILVLAIREASRSGYKPPAEAAEIARLRALTWEIRAEVDLLNDLMVRDTVSTLIPAVPGVFVRGPARDASVLDYVEHVMRRDATADSALALGFVALPFEYGMQGEIPSFMPPLYYAGVRGELPYCVHVVASDLPLDRAAVIAHGESLLGPCAFWARYGKPGPQIGEWLSRIGARFAVDDRPSNARDIDVQEAGRFGEEKPLPGDAHGRGCLGGDKTDCLAAVLNADSLHRGHPSLAIGHFSPPRLAPGEEGMLADLEFEFGRARFERFWKADAPVADAFESAFGEPLGEWVAGWVSRRYGTMQTGADMSLATVSLSLLFIGIFVGLALAAANARRI